MYFSCLQSAIKIPSYIVLQLFKVYNIDTISTVLELLTVCNKDTTFFRKCCLLLLVVIQKGLWPAFLSSSPYTYFLYGSINTIQPTPLMVSPISLDLVLYFSCLQSTIKIPSYIVLQLFTVYNKDAISIVLELITVCNIDTISIVLELLTVCNKDTISSGSVVYYYLLLSRKGFGLPSCLARLIATFLWEYKYYPTYSLNGFSDKLRRRRKGSVKIIVRLAARFRHEKEANLSYRRCNFCFNFCRFLLMEYYNTTSSKKEWESIKITFAKIFSLLPCFLFAWKCLLQGQNITLYFGRGGQRSTICQNNLVWENIEYTRFLEYFWWEILEG